MGSQESIPLKGIRVLEITNSVQGLVASQMLADLGAEVIRLEPPGNGQQTQESGVALYGQNLDLTSGRSLLRDAYNRGKKSVTVDLTQPKAREILYRLVEGSDVFLTDALPAEMHRLGSDEETLRTYNAKLIYARATAYGSKGPDAERSGNDITAAARSGVMVSLVNTDEPVHPRHAISEVLSGTMLVFGLVTALLARDRLGVAQPVESSLLNSLMWLQALGIGLYANKGVEFMRYDRKSSVAALLGQYKCQDGKWLTIGVFARGERDWVQFCGVMGLEKYIEDPRFAGTAERHANNSALVDLLDQAFATKPRAYWEEQFKARSFSFSTVNTVPDLLTDPQVVANEYMATSENGLKFVTLPFKLSASESNSAGSPPLGRDTQDVLVNLCGFSSEEAKALVSAGVV